MSDNNWSGVGYVLAIGAVILIVFGMCKASRFNCTELMANARTHADTVVVLSSTETLTRSTCREVLR